MDIIGREYAIAEARYCLLCDDAPCWHGCPAGVNPKRFIRKIRFENFAGAVRELRRANVLAGCCSYICPCETTCVGKCTSEKLDRPVDIIRLQRFICEWEIQHGMVEPVNVAAELALQDWAKQALPLQRARVAVVGAGPAGLACAAELAVRGYMPVVFDLCEKAGGMLRQAIPTFRLPAGMLDFEIEFIKKLGVEFALGSAIADPAKLLSDGFKAVYLAAGLASSKNADIIGADKKGVIQALEFLREQKNVAAELALPESAKQASRLQGKCVSPGQRVLVIGGGDTAIDSTRTAARMGALVTLVYRRTRRDMPAYRPDIAEAEKEGVEFLFRLMPRSVIGAEKAEGLKAVRVRWHGGGRTAEGYSIEGSEFTIPCDIIILALGQKPASLFNLRASPAGYLAVDKNMMTSTPGIFAGGDIVSGPSTAVAAVGAGKLAAGFIDEYLKGENTKRNL